MGELKPVAAVFNVETTRRLSIVDPSDISGERIETKDLGLLQDRDCCEFS